jgi:hypothetical protein
MPLIVKKPRDILLFRSGVASTATSLNEVVEQLQAQNKQLQAQL